jgi:Trk K+ transport system NAD-binding subunit
MSEASPVAGPIEADSRSDHVVLCGLGTVGVSVTESLLQAGADVVVVDNGPSTPFREGLGRLGVPVVEGDCTHADTLRRARVDRAQAVIVVVSHDMVSLQTALAAREMNAQARIVIRLFNLRTAHLLRDLPAGITALSLSATVAQVFTLAARCSALRGAFTLGGAIWAIGSLQAPTDGEPLPVERWRRRGLAPLIGTTVDGREILCPPAGTLLAPGGTVLVVAAPERLEMLGARPGALATALLEPALPLPVPRRTSRRNPPLGTALRRKPVARLRRTLYLAWNHTHLGLRVALIALWSLVGASILIFHFFYPLHFLDAVYFTTELITTVGLGDVTLIHSDGALKVFGVFVMLGGAAMMAVVYGMLAAWVLSARLEALLGEPAEDMRDHYVVAGLGAVGFRVVTELHEAGEHIVAIESAENGRFVAQVRAMHIPVILGDAAQEETLRRAQVSHAQAFIGVTSNDLVNIESVLTARALQPGGHVVLRVFDAPLAAQVRRGLGIPASFSASQIGAPAFVSAALGHNVPQVLTLPVDEQTGVTHRVALTFIRSTDEEGQGRTVGEIATRRNGVAILLLPASVPESPIVAPPDDRFLENGDTLVLAVPAA